MKTALQQQAVEAVRYPWLRDNCAVPLLAAAIAAAIRELADNEGETK